MRDFTRRVLETARERGATYADVRVVRNSNERLVVQTSPWTAPCGSPREQSP